MLIELLQARLCHIHRRRRAVARLPRTPRGHARDLLIDSPLEILDVLERLQAEAGRGRALARRPNRHIDTVRQLECPVASLIAQRPHGPIASIEGKRRHKSIPIVAHDVVERRTGEILPVDVDLELEADQMAVVDDREGRQRPRALASCRAEKERSDVVVGVA